MIVDDYNVKAIHTFQIRTLSSLGYKTRVCLSNNSHYRHNLATQYIIDISIFSPEGELEDYLTNTGEFSPSEKIIFEVGDYCKKEDGKDRILIFHLIPKKYYKNVENEINISISKKDLWEYFTAQDHYVEYYNDTGFSSGVLYQSGAFNYPKFSKGNTTIIQAPKCFQSNEHDTYFSVSNVGFTHDYKITSELNCSLVNEKNEIVKKWVTHVKPYTSELIKVSDLIEGNGHFTFYCLSMNSTVLPLTINHGKKYNTIAVEHSLPPNYYGSMVIGQNRHNILKDLEDSIYFKKKA